MLERLQTKKMTIEFLKQNNLIIFETVSGSRAYGTDLPTSDEDRRGVFILPKNDFFGLTKIDQVSDEKNDNVYYELRRFVELLSKSNPNMLEMLAMPEDCILVKEPLFEKFKPEIFLSKQCKKTFAGYAMTQVQKARGLNKKIMNPVGKERKSILDFCFVIQDYGSIPLKKWLVKKGLEQRKCGLVNIAHFQDTYAIFYDENDDLGFKGIENKPTANMVSLSSIPEGIDSIGYMSFNINGYQKYCKDYRDYWRWVKKRNEVRYENTVSHGKNYDAKNMLHTFRLLDMAEEIAQFGEIRVCRPNREFLLQIRKGDFEYEDLLKQAEQKIERIEDLYAKSDLPEKLNLRQINNILVEIRELWYQ